MPIPIPAHSRQNRPQTPASTSSAATTTPVRAKPVHSMSPAPSNTTYTPTLTSGSSQQKLNNVVTRVAIEGKAKKGDDGASIRMYLKFTIPSDQVQPGMTIPLFPEENVKIMSSQVHPLNNHSVPYNFSSTLSPLLHKAARALNLPARSTESFNVAFSIPQHSGVNINGGGSENIPTVDPQYTGHILISGYQVSYVVPKVFLARSKNLSDTESDEPVRKSRRMSIGERESAQFMAAIEMCIPFVSQPPRYPYLLSIPVPRCLHNNIKLRIFPPTAPNASYHSLSSVEDDIISWDLTSDPHVTRGMTRPSRSNSYSHFADDESSDSSASGFSGGSTMQGTFPSAERIRIRWAKPIRNIDVLDGQHDGRRRVGVKEVKGEMTCVIRGKLEVKERNNAVGVLMDIVYKGTCRNVWFPGVATLLGLDVGLETKGSDAYWVEGASSSWEVSGADGFQGFDIGPSSRQAGLQSRTTSLDSNSSSAASQVHIPTSTQDQTMRTNLASSTSLLRGPLPSQAAGDYSFEASSASMSSSALSSISSLTPGSETSSLAASRAPPGLPITIHVNMNELITPAKNIFNFTISGTVLVIARSTLLSTSNSSSPTHSEDEYNNNLDHDPKPIVLPRFTVLAADSEATNTIVRNEVLGPSASVEVYNPTGDLYRDAQARKTVLQKGGFTKCNDTGSRIALRSIGASHGDFDGFRHSKQQSGPRTPTARTTALPHVTSNSSVPIKSVSARRLKRIVPSVIPSVAASVTPLLQDGGFTRKSYAVRIRLDVPADATAEWLEFGLVQTERDDSHEPPTLKIVRATVEGLPVEHEATVGAKPQASGLGLVFDDMSGKNWLSWMKIHVGEGGGTVVVDYIVSQPQLKGETRAKDDRSLRVLLPAFSVSVGIYEVNISSSGMDIASLRSNFVHQYSSNKESTLLNHSMDEFFSPDVVLKLRPIQKPFSPWLKLALVMMITWALIASGFVKTYRLIREQERWLAPIPSDTATATAETTAIDLIVITETMTSTLYTTVTHTIWEERSSPTSSDTPKPSPHVPIVTPIPVAPPTLEHLNPEDESDHQTSHLLERYSLSVPIPRFLNITWTLRDFDATMDQVMKTLEKAWYILRKAYHYPLDPP
ncbi:hypothetical protein H0H93_011733 [Arthromyces matolae]|nr:hypothetical protein H0H93_011733 [Arthromyces matolae]